MHTSMYSMEHKSLAAEQTSAIKLQKKIRHRSARVSVIGLGYVGLSLAVEMAKKGYQITGVDLDAGKVNAVNAGISDNPHVPSEILLSFVSQGRLKATQVLSTVGDVDVASICVPTPLRTTKDPDLSYVVAAIEFIGNHLRPGQLIVLESTTYPGTTRKLVLPILEKSGLQLGEDFFLAYSPARVDPGNLTYTYSNVPKIISGMTPRCTELAALFYEAFVDRVIRVSSPEVAEMVKLFENAFRNVNIGLANEMALLSHEIGINVWEVIEAAQTKPFGFMAFYPGPGFGGGAVSVDPNYLTRKAMMGGFQSRLIEMAIDINSRMSKFTIERVAEALNEKGKSLKGSMILALGVTCKRNSNDLRDSPAIEVLCGLRKKGASICYSDPYVASIEIEGETMKSFQLTADMVQSMDCVVVLTDHAGFDYAMIAAHGALIVDTRNGFKNFSGPNIIPL